MSQLVSILSETITPTLNDLGFDLVKIDVNHNDATMSVEILIDRLDGKHLSIRDCKNASTNIAALLDVEDVIKGKYYLNVSSPGVERPLVRMKDYQKFMGRNIRMRLKSPLNGTSHYKGVLQSAQETPVAQVVIKTDAEEVTVPLEMIKSAHLVLSDQDFKDILNGRS